MPVYWFLILHSQYARCPLLSTISSQNVHVSHHFKFKLEWLQDVFPVIIISLSSEGSDQLNILLHRLHLHLLSHLQDVRQLHSSSKQMWVFLHPLCSFLAVLDIFSLDRQN